MQEKKYLIIFDMDNTLIHSHIDFALMKSETCRLLRGAGLTQDETLPVAQILVGLKRQGLLTQELEARVWHVICEIEAVGLAGATAEPQIELVLDLLSPHAHLVALTNTNAEAARLSLEQLGLARRFAHIMGRGGAPELKPAPDGMLALLSYFPQLTPADALAVGDALIDIRAARAAGLAFCAYNRSRQECWQEAGLNPDLQLTCWDEDAAAAILKLLRCG